MFGNSNTKIQGFRTLVFAAVFSVSIPGAALANCVYYFNWSCPGCGKIGGATSGQTGPYSSLNQCNSARSRVHSTVSAGSCVPQGVCQVPGSQQPGAQIPTVDPSVERKRLEEAERLKTEQQQAEQRRKFNQEKNEALEQLKRMAGPKGAEVPQLKSPDPAGTGGTPKLKPVTRVIPTNVVDATQTQVDKADPAWVSEVQNASRAAIQLRRSEIAAMTRSFKMKEPPPPQLPRLLSKSKAGDIILVGPDTSTLTNTALGFVQGLGEDWGFGNERGNVTHALVFLGMKGGKRLYLDNQYGEGPLIIEEAEFKRRYGQRALYSAQPTLLPDGQELFKAAFAFAKANAEAWKRDPGKENIYGIFGEGKVVCSETALLAVIQAQAVKTGPGKIFTADYVGGKKINPISITPGDIYNQDGKGYFTVRPMVINGKS